jgi:hypothetical protein
LPLSIFIAMKAKNIGKRTWRSSLIELTVALIVLSTLGYYVIEGTVDGAPGAAVMIVVPWVAFIANRGRLAGLTMTIGASTFVLYTLTAGCKMKGCFPDSEWDVGLKLQTQVVGVCIDDGCSRVSLPTTVVEGFTDWVVSTSARQLGHTRVRVATGESGDATVQYFDIPGEAFKDRRYALKVETSDGEVLTKRVRPSKYYCNGKRCGDPLLNFSFTV